jgi:hypothetical protein
MTERRGHWWSGWPGAICLKCGAEDPREISLADGGDGEVPPEQLVCPAFDSPAVYAGYEILDSAGRNQGEAVNSDQA